MAAEFSFGQFLWIVFIFVGVPTSVWALAIWSKLLKEQAGRAQTGPGRLGLLPTGAIAFGLGFLSCAAWLTWSADYMGGFRGPALPAPNQFPTWQVVACGVTVVLACFGSAHLSRWAKTGGLAAAAGTTAGFTTAFCVSASTDVTGQSGVGVLLSMLGWGISLGLLMSARGLLMNRTASP